MKIKLRTGEIFIIILELMSFAVSLIFYWALPDKIAVSFSGSGWAVGGISREFEWIGSDPRWMVGYNAKFFGTFVFNLFMLAIGLVYFIIPRYKNRLFDIRYRYYDRFVIFIFAALLSFQLFIIYWNFVAKWQPDLRGILSILVGAFIFLVGDIIQHSKPGWFFSLSNKWLTNENVWEKTCRIGGFWMKIGGILFAITLYFKLGLIGSFISLPLAYGFLYLIIHPVIAVRRLKKLNKVEKI